MGLSSLWLCPFIQRSPDNFVAALANSWLTHVDSALKWEEAHPGLCHRMRYEDLVTAPQDTLAVFPKFLGTDSEASLLQAAFEKARSASGPGDYKVVFTKNVHPLSIGRGKRVPVGMLPPSLRDAVNEKLTLLGYEPVTNAWNAEPLARADLGRGAGLADMIRRVHPTPSDGTNGAIRTFAILAEDALDLRWVIDRIAGVVREGDGEVESVITGTAQDLVLLLSGEVNPGVLLRSGRIRHLTAREDIFPDEVSRRVRLVLEMLSDASRCL